MKEINRNHMHTKLRREGGRNERMGGKEKGKEI